MSVLEQGSISMLQADDFEQLVCAVSGEINIHLVTGWQRYQLYAGEPFPKSGEPMPPNYSHLDITEGLEGTRVHMMTLSKGDCVFVPSFWWYQVEVPKTEKGKKKRHALIVKYEYDVSSTWIDLVMYGINNGIL